jgi:hypothetical protein
MTSPYRNILLQLPIFKHDQSNLFPQNERPKFTLVWWTKLYDLPVSIIKFYTENRKTKSFTVKSSQHFLNLLCSWFIRKCSLQYIFFKVSQTQNRAHVYFKATCFSSILSHHQTFSKNDYTESLKLHLYTDLWHTCITIRINTHKYVKGWHIYIHLQCILTQRGVLSQSSFKLPVSSFIEEHDGGSE